MKVTNTYHESLVVTGAHKTLLPVVAHRTPDGIRQTLFDRKGQAHVVILDLEVLARVVAPRRRVGDATARIHKPWLGTRRGRRRSLSGWVDDGRAAGHDWIG